MTLDDQESRTCYCCSRSSSVGLLLVQNRVPLVTVDVLVRQTHEGVKPAAVWHDTAAEVSVNAAVRVRVQLNCVLDTGPLPGKGRIARAQ